MDPNLPFTKTVGVTWTDRTCQPWTRQGKTPANQPVDQWNSQLREPRGIWGMGPRGVEGGAGHTR